MSPSSRRRTGSCSARKASCKRTDQQFHWRNAGYATLRRFPGRARLAQAQGHPPRTQRRAVERGITIHQLTGSRSDRKRLGRLFRVLHGHRLAQMGPPLSHPRLLLDDRREHGRPDPAGDGQAQRPLYRGRHQFHRRRHAVRPALGRDRASPVPAFRALLLSGDRLCDRQQAEGCRGRRAGRTQAGARLCAGDHLFLALHRRSGAAPRDRRLSEKRARLCRRGRTRA